MMLATEARLNMLAGGLRVKVRVRHPQVKPRTDRQGHPWVFRYWFDEIQPDGSVKTLRKYQVVGLSKGDGAINKKQAEVERDKFLAKLNAPTAELAVQQVAATGVASFESVAELYIEGYLGREKQISTPTRKLFYLRHYVIPRWGSMRLNQIQAQAVADWLHKTFASDWTKHGVRAIMIRVFNHAEGYGLWEEGKRNPVSKAKLGKRRLKRERRILTFEETARVLLRLEEPYRLIIELCIATGARISEVLALQWKHLDLKAGTIKIEQRVWHQEISRPKSEGSKRTLGVGDLVTRFQELGRQEAANKEELIFQQKRAPGKPLWDSGARDALHQAAQAEDCDFEGLGPHSFRRANITWRQQVGGSAIEASKIAGHSDLEMTSEYTVVAPERQNELTRRIQDKISQAASKFDLKSRSPLPLADVPRSVADSTPATTTIQ